jgi:hypothetical protein
MPLDQSTLEAMRRQHPAWHLLAADSTPLVASFLQRVFVVPNVRTMAQSDPARRPRPAGSDVVRAPGAVPADPFQWHISC